MTPQEFVNLINKHKGVQSSEVVQTYTEDPELGIKSPDPNPPIKYLFNDGVWVVVRRSVGPDGRPGDEFTITNSGEIGGVFESETTSAGNPVTRTVNGKTYQWNAQTEQWELAPGLPAEEAEDPEKSATVIAARISAAQSAANRELQERLAMIEHDLEERKLSVQEAIAKANEEYKRIELELQKETNRLTERGQEVTMRGQDLNFAWNIAGTAADLMKSTMPFMAPKGTAEDLANLMNSFATGQPAQVGVRSAPMPFDPSTWVQNQVAEILKGLSPTAKGIYYAGGAPFPTGESASPAFQAPRPAGVVNPQLTLPPKMFQ